MANRKRGSDQRLRLGEAADALGVSIDTVRRWATLGKLKVERTAGGQRQVSRSEVAALAAARRGERRETPIVAQSARNRFPGVVTRVVRDKAAAVVEVQAGPHRLVSLVTREAVDDLELEAGTSVVCVVKATDVIVELPSR